MPRLCQFSFGSRFFVTGLFNHNAIFSSGCSKDILVAGDMSRGHRGHAHGPVEFPGQTEEADPLATLSNANWGLTWKRTTSHADSPTQKRRIPLPAAVPVLGTLIGLVFYFNTLGCTRWSEFQNKCQAFEDLGGIVRGMDCFKAGISYVLSTLLAVFIGMFAVDFLTTPSEHRKAKTTRMTSAPRTPQLQQLSQDTCMFSNIRRPSTI